MSRFTSIRSFRLLEKSLSALSLCPGALEFSTKRKEFRQFLTPEIADKLDKRIEPNALLMTQQHQQEECAFLNQNKNKNKSTNNPSEIALEAAKLALAESFRAPVVVDMNSSNNNSNKSEKRQQLIAGTDSSPPPTQQFPLSTLTDRYRASFELLRTMNHNILFFVDRIWWRTLPCGGGIISDKQHRFIHSPRRDGNPYSSNSMLRNKSHDILSVMRSFSSPPSSTNKRNLETEEEMDDDDDDDEGGIDISDYFEYDHDVEVHDLDSILTAESGAIITPEEKEAILKHHLQHSSRRRKNNINSSYHRFIENSPMFQHLLQRQITVHRPKTHRDTERLWRSQTFRLCFAAAGIYMKLILSVDPTAIHHLQQQKFLQQQQKQKENNNNNSSKIGEENSNSKKGLKTSFIAPPSSSSNASSSISSSPSNFAAAEEIASMFPLLQKQKKLLIEKGKQNLNSNSTNKSNNNEIITFDPTQTVVCELYHRGMRALSFYVLLCELTTQIKNFAPFEDAATFSQLLFEATNTSNTNSNSNRNNNTESIIDENAKALFCSLPRPYEISTFSELFLQTKKLNTNLMDLLKTLNNNNNNNNNNNDSNDSHDNQPKKVFVEVKEENNNNNIVTPPPQAETLVRCVCHAVECILEYLNEGVVAVDADNSSTSSSSNNKNNNSITLSRTLLPIFDDPIISSTQEETKIENQQTTTSLPPLHRRCSMQAALFLLAGVFSRLGLEWRSSKETGDVFARALLLSSDKTVFNRRDNVNLRGRGGKPSKQTQQTIIDEKGNVVSDKNVLLDDDYVVVDNENDNPEDDFITARALKNKNMHFAEKYSERQFKYNTNLRNFDTVDIEMENSSPPHRLEVQIQGMIMTSRLKRVPVVPNSSSSSPQKNIELDQNNNNNEKNNNNNNNKEEETTTTQNSTSSNKNSSSSSSSSSLPKTKLTRISCCEFRNFPVSIHLYRTSAASPIIYAAVAAPNDLANKIKRSLLMQFTTVLPNDSSSSTTTFSSFDNNNNNDNNNNPATPSSQQQNYGKNDNEDADNETIKDFISTSKQNKQHLTSEEESFLNSREFHSKNSPSSPSFPGNTRNTRVRSSAASSSSSNSREDPVLALTSHLCHSHLTKCEILAFDELQSEAEKSKHMKLLSDATTLWTSVLQLF